MLSFKEFIIQELDAAPGMGSGPTAPPSPGKSKTVNDFSYGQRELGIDSDIAPEELFKGGLTSFDALNIPGQPRYNSPIFLDLEKGDRDGSARLKILNTGTSRDKIRNANGTRYTGDLKDRKVILRGRNVPGALTWSDLELNPFAKAGGGTPGLPPPPGGM